MSWWESLVQIRRNDLEKGSGVFISETEVLTAAHVVTQDGAPLPLAKLTMDIRYQSLLAVPVAVAVLPSWITSGLTASDIALVRVEARSGLGLPTVFGVPAPSASAMLESVGFEAQNDTEQRLSSSVQCRVGPAGERLLYSKDFAPIGGMSGGPVYVGLASGIHVAGILIRESGSGLIGLSVTASVLAQLRSQL
jgi:hypothetical protein